MSALSEKECVACKGGVPPLKGGELKWLAEQLGGGWSVVNEHHLEKEYPFKDFREALAFTNRVGELAEGQGHHPDTYLRKRLGKGATLVKEKEGRAAVAAAAAK